MSQSTIRKSKRAQSRKKAHPPTAATAMVKRSITLERAVDEAAHTLVGDRGFSELVNDAVKRLVQRRMIEQDVAAYEAEFGPIPQDVLERARAKVFQP